MSWYVMHSKPQKEQWLCKQLDALDIEFYCPYLVPRNHKSHAAIVKPYFPGYLFVNVDLALTGVSMLQWIPGSLGLVSFGGEPACVPEGLLQRIRHRVEEINNAAESFLSSLKAGDNVTIESGPFAGYEAIFCARLRDDQRVQVLLKVLQQQGLKIDLKASQIKWKKQNRTLQ